MQGFRERPEAPKDVLDYWNARSANIAVSFDWRDIWAQEQAQAFTVAKAMRRDILITLKNAVDRAIKDGVPFKTFAKEIEPELQKLGWWGTQDKVDPLTGKTKTVRLGSPRRLRTIYQGNVRPARTAGFWQRVQRTKRALPYLRYRIGPSEVHRPKHVEQEGKIYRVDDVYWIYWLGPNGWGCKCWAEQLSAAEAERLGGVSPQTDLKLREYKNKRTGETALIPEGIDPGWHTNPGISHLSFAASGQKLKDSIKAASAIISDRTFERSDMLDISKSFQQAPAFINVIARSNALIDSGAPRIKNEISRIAAPIALLPDRIVKTLDVPEAASINVNVWTMQKQLAKHPELDASDYLKLQAAVLDGDLYQHNDIDKLVVLYQDGDAWLHAVLMRNRARYEVNLIQLMRIDDRRKEAIIRNLKKR